MAISPDLPDPGPRPGPELGPMTPAVFHILLALAPAPAHGYGIMQAVEKITEGRTRLGPGTLYRSLQRMLVDGLVEEITLRREDEPEDDRRRFYRLTSMGRGFAREEAERLAVLVAAARKRRLLPGSRRG